MTFTLTVDGPAWRTHLESVRDATPGLVPVAKGNGYGFGVARLAEEAQRLGARTLAVGTPAELEVAREAFHGDVVVLEPWDPAYSAPPKADRSGRTVLTVASAAGVAGLRGSGARLVVELETSMHRFGIPFAELETAIRELDGVEVGGIALHLPLDAPPSGRAAEVATAIARAHDLPVFAPPTQVWVSHLQGAELHGLRTAHPTVDFRPRVGTGLWLGRRDLLAATGTVLAVHRGVATYGYRQRSLPRDQQLVVVSGGTAHGVGLEAPKPVSGVVGRGKEAARGLVSAAGRSLSPFSVGGKQRWYAEPPHMQVSMLLVPEDVPVEVGERLACDVRFTTTTFDVVEGL